jgi:hypothetical protein
MFTLVEANALLPEIEKLLAQLHNHREFHQRLHDRFFMQELLHQADKKASNLDQDAKHVDDTALELEKIVDQIHALGCALRSLEPDIIDFLGNWNEEPVYFCWRRGEKEILFYRSLNSPISERVLLRV